MGRPRKPVELKKLEGTFRKDRDGERDNVQLTLNKTTMLLHKKSLPCPRSITDDYVIKYWRDLTKALLSIHVLSGADLPQIEMMCKILERIRKVQRDLDTLDSDDLETEEILEKRYLNLVTRFDVLASKYYVSPQARSKLTLDELNVVKTGQDIAKGADAISALLGGRK
jgi:phage terminase small subunit